MRSHGRALLALTALAVLLLDQLTKWLVVQNLAVGVPVPGPDTALGRFFSLTHVHNTGVAFGLGKGNNGLFTLVALAVVGGIFLYERRLPAGAIWPRLALGLVAGGALGNIVDRLRQGHVTDFLDFKFWPVFNLADSCVVVGVLALAVWLWRSDASAPEAAEAAPATPRAAEGLPPPATAED
jgi:signal peptidase II